LITITLKVVTIIIVITFVLKHPQKGNKPICMVSCNYNFRQHDMNECHKRNYQSVSIKQLKKRKITLIVDIDIYADNKPVA